MVKTVVLCVLVCNGMCQLSSHAKQVLTDTSIPNLPAIVVSNINVIDIQIEPRPIHNYTVGHQIIHVNAPLLETAGFPGDFNNILYTPRRDYVVTNGMGAHKVHRRTLTWGQARQTCIDEGGHLAVIRSKSEEMILLEMMTNHSLEYAWVGYHNQFDQREWISVFDEPLEDGGWRHWSTKYDHGSYNCARLVTQGEIEGYIKSNFALYTRQNGNGDSFGCGSVTDGEYKLEIHIANFSNEYEFRKGDHVLVNGYIERSADPVFLNVNSTRVINFVDDRQMSLEELLAGYKVVQIDHNDRP